MKADPMSVYALAKKTAGPYVGKGIDFEDLVSIAMVGAVIASNKFDPEKGAYTTVSVIWMRNELNKACYRQRRIDGKSYRPVRFIEETVDDYKLSILAGTDDSSNPEAIYEASKFDDSVRKIMRTLSERERLAFNDYYYIGKYDNYRKAYNVDHARSVKMAGHARLKVESRLKSYYERLNCEIH